MTHYIALIHKEADSGYGVSFPDVPGVIAVADTLDDALREAGVASASHSKIGKVEHPAPSTLYDLRKDTGFQKWPTDAVGLTIALISGRL